MVAFFFVWFVIVAVFANCATDAKTVPWSSASHVTTAAALPEMPEHWSASSTLGVI